MTELSLSRKGACAPACTCPCVGWMDVTTTTLALHLVPEHRLPALTSARVMTKSLTGTADFTVSGSLVSYLLSVMWASVKLTLQTSNSSPLLQTFVQAARTGRGRCVGRTG